jgi:hypothetical protein
MAYDGIFRAETIITDALGNLAAAVAAVASEHALTVPAPGTVYTYPLEDFPVGDGRPVEVQGPQGPLDGNACSTAGELVYWVTVSAKGAKKDVLAAQLNVYLTALVRVLDKQRAADGRWSTEVGRVDYAPPSTGGRDSTFAGATGVEVVVRIADTR